MSAYIYSTQCPPVGCPQLATRSHYASVFLCVCTCICMCMPMCVCAGAGGGYSVPRLSLVCVCVCVRLCTCAYICTCAYAGACVRPIQSHVWWQHRFMAFGGRSRKDPINLHLFLAAPSHKATGCKSLSRRQNNTQNAEGPCHPLLICGRGAGGCIQRAGRAA